jgi:hypothetical protein
MNILTNLDAKNFYLPKEDALETYSDFPATHIEKHCFVKCPSIADQQIGVFDKTGQFISSTGLQRGNAPILTGNYIAPIANESIEEPHLYLGVLFSHFGHCLIESLARVWPLLTGTVPKNTPLALIEHPNKDTKMLKSWLEVLGFPNQRITLVKDVTLFTELIIPEPGIIIRKLGFTGHLQSLQKAFLATVDEDKKNKSCSGTVYLSRKKLTSDKRIIIGEQYIEDYLSSAGVDILYPETFSLKEQIITLRKYETIIGYVGSAFHNLFFCEQGVNAVYLCANPPIKTYHIIDKIVGVNSIFVNDSKAGGIEGFSYINLHNEPILPNFPKLFDFFESINIAGTRPNFDKKLLLIDFMTHWQRNVCQTLFNKSTAGVQKKLTKKQLHQLTLTMGNNIKTMENNIKVMAESLID